MRFLHIVHRRDSPPTFSAFGLNLTCGNYCLEHATFCSFLSTSNCHLECARSWECSLVLFASRARQDQPSLVFLKATSPPLHLDGERGGGGGGKQTATRRLGGNFWRPTSPSPPTSFFRRLLLASVWLSSRAKGETCYSNLRVLKTLAFVYRVWLEFTRIFLGSILEQRLFASPVILDQRLFASSPRWLPGSC